MRKAPRRVALLLLLALVASFSPGTEAIVIRHDRADERHRELAGRFPVCSLNLGGWGGGCTLIAPQWAITAAHAAGRVAPGARIVVGTQEVEVAEIVPHPEFDLQTYRNDLALIRLASPVDDPPPVQLYRGRSEVGQTVIFLGRGYSGTGETGAEIKDHVLRAAENRVEDADEHWLRFVFDAPPEAVELEGISGPGDSGGPAFLETEDGLRLVGISSWQDQGDLGAEGVYGVKESYTRVSSYLPWIDETVATEAPSNKP